MMHELMGDCDSICCSQLLHKVRKVSSFSLLNPCSRKEVVINTKPPQYRRPSTMFILIKSRANDTRPIKNNHTQLTTLFQLCVLTVCARHIRLPELCNPVCLGLLSKFCSRSGVSCFILEMH